MSDPHALTAPDLYPDLDAALDAIEAALRGRAYLCPNEAALQARLAETLTTAGIGAEREVALSARDRIDFLTAAGVGIEVKVAGSADTALRQLHRYAAHRRIRALVLVTTRARHLHMPPDLRGVPLRVVFLDGLGGLR